MEACAQTCVQYLMSWILVQHFEYIDGCVEGIPGMPNLIFMSVAAIWHLKNVFNVFFFRIYVSRPLTLNDLKTNFRAEIANISADV